MPQHAIEYTGPERRRRKVYLTRNTEYHFLDEVCVAVRHRDSGQWRGRHQVWGRRTPVRTTLYIAALVGSRHNPAIRSFYQRLLRTILSALLHHQTPAQEDHHATTP